MAKHIFDQMLSEWARFYYMQIFVTICQLVALAIGLASAKRQRQILFLLLYIIYGLFYFSAAQYFTAYTRVKESEQTLYALEEIFTTAFTIIEFYSFSYLFFKLYRQIFAKRTLQFMSLILFCVITLFVAQLLRGSDPKQIIYLSYFISGLEMTFLAILCLVYFYTLFRSIHEINLLETPEFWIVTGLFFYSAVIIPFLLLNDHIYGKIYTYYGFIHYISFGFLYLFIGKAFLSKNQPQFNHKN